VSDELRACFEDCCHWVNSHAVGRTEFEQAVLRNDPVHQNPIMAKVRCPKGLSAASDAIEKKLGFYVGIHTRRSGSNLPDARNPPIFEKATDQSRGDATDVDLQQWKDAHKDTAQSQD
jgi:hypothetical protein